MDAYSSVIILLALIGFLLLAAIILVPFYLFLRRERKASEQWTPEALARRYRETPPAPNGTPRRDVDGEDTPAS